MAEEKKALRAGSKLPGLLKNKWFVLPVYFLAVVVLSTVVWMRILNPLYPWQRTTNPQPVAPTVDTNTPKAPETTKQTPVTTSGQGQKEPAVATTTQVQTPTTPVNQSQSSAPTSTSASQEPASKPASAPTQTTKSAPPEEVLPVAIVYEKPEPSDTEVIWPVSPVNITVRFGRQYSKTMEDWRLHQGVDITVAENTLVRAALNGKVASTYTDAQLGEVIVLEHAGGIRTKYANLVKADLPIGKTVQRGETIGKVGLTARYESADGPHLHFEIIEDDAAVDPMEMIKEN